jgi:hypothetical protein
MYKVYIQSVNNFPISDWSVSAYLGFKDKQMDIIFFEDIEEVPANPNNIVVSFIEDTIKHFKTLGINPPLSINIPNELMEYTKRNIRYMTMGEFKQDTQIPVFVKPNRFAKEFVAGVIKNQSSKALFFNDISDDTPVLVSDVIDIVSEYRCYVLKKELKGIKHYIGDIRIFPDVKVIDAAIADYTSAPSAYVIDFGITKDGETVVVEVNDAWSVGNYGLNDTTYANMLLTRWIEIMKDYKTPTYPHIKINKI